MKAIKLIFGAALISSFMLWSCRDESLNPVPAWETGVHGYTTLGFTPDVPYSKVIKTKTKDGKKDSTYIANLKADSDDSLNTKDLNKAARFYHNWQSNDKLNTVTKIDFYVYWDEFYVDINGNDRRARHGGFVFDDPGKLFKTVTSPKGNREAAEYTLTLNEILNLYKGTKFDYNDGKGIVEVLKNPGRTDAAPFTEKDVFHIRWKLTTADGRTFENWNPDICEDVIPGLNCQAHIGVDTF
jgi:hypothetical protein